MALPKWKKGLPKWRQELTKVLNDHLIETTDSPTKAQFRSNRAFQRKHSAICWECWEIERRLDK